MSVQLGITLLSGKCVYIQASPEDSLDVLGQQAQIALGVGRGSLQSPGGEDLRGSRTVEQAGLRMRQVQVFSSRRSSAFAAILGDGVIVTWGHPDCGGDSSAV